MVNHIVLARKYRPIFLNDIIGQNNSTDIIKIGLKNNNLGHAFMFSGIRGTGKTTIARILARAFNCQNDIESDANSESKNNFNFNNDQEIDFNDFLNIDSIDDINNANENNTVPCDKCSSCKSFLEGDNIDIIEIDAASNTGIDDIREIISNVQYKPFYKFKIYIIDEVHMLSKGAFNALLKTLEEPPEHVKFIFATTEIKKVPATILSRCLVFNLNSINEDDIFFNLKKISDLEGYRYEDSGLKIIAKVASGSIRDSLSILDQVKLKGDITFNNVTKILSLFDVKTLHDLLIAILNKDKKYIIQFFKNFNSDIEFLLKEIMQAIYEYIKYKTINDIINELYSNAEIIKLLEKNSMSDILILWECLTKFSQRKHINPILGLEIELIKYCYIDELILIKKDK